ncbi:MAG: sulfur carrier protein ThiS [Pseudomonadota bacterium]
MQIVLNGENRELTENTTIAELVLSLGGDPRGIAIERNLEIVPKSEHGKTVLMEGDQLEIVQFVGGG